MDSIARENNIVLNIKLSGVMRLASIGLNLMLVPLMLRFLGQVEYGIWLTISSFLGWSALLDLGIGNGLKNKLGESLANNRDQDLKSYTSSAYIVISIVALCAFLIFSALIFAFDWVSILGVSGVSEQRIKSVLFIFIFFFCSKIVFNQILNIASADQKTSVSDLVNLLINALTFVSIILVVNYTGDRLFSIALIAGIVPVTILLVVSIVLFNGRYKDFRPSLKHFSKVKARSVMGLGSRFFIIQIAGIILFSTDNLIISHFIGPESVTGYHISFRYFGLVSTLFALLSIPIWPAYTEAYQKGDMVWIKKITRRLIKAWMLLVLLVGVMLLCAPMVYSLWIGDEVVISSNLSAVMALYVVAVTWGSIFVTFINSTGKLRVQLVCSIIAGLVNIPLSIYFIEHTSLGSAGVMLATIICLSYGPILSVIQYKKLVNRTAKGIWTR